MEIREYGTNPTLETRAESNAAVDREKRYRQIMAILAGSKGMTAKEIAVQMCYKGLIPTTERNFAAPRLTEMCEKGMVEPVGKKICEYTGKKVTVYALRGIEIQGKVLRPVAFVSAQYSIDDLMREESNG